jgi:hypothetical protein
MVKLMTKETTIIVSLAAVRFVDGMQLVVAIIVAIISGARAKCG